MPNADKDAPAVTSVEPGCTCGGMAACPQCQERDAATARVIPPGMDTDESGD